MKKILLTSLLVLVILGEVLFHPRLIFGKEGTTIKTGSLIFYIPSDTPLKIYAFSPKPKELEEIIQRHSQKYPGTLGVLIKNLSTGQEVGLNTNESFTAASLYKLAVMYTIFDLDSKGVLDVTQLDIESNLNSMITVSSNEAAYFLINNYTSWDEVTDKMHSIGLNDTSLMHSPPVTTPADMGKLLERIAKGEAVNFEASVKMLELLAEQKRNDRIPQLLPSDAIIAHKTGELGDVRHDAGVVISPENNYILVLMSKDYDYPEEVKPIMAQMSAEIYDFFRKQWSNPPEIL